MPLRKITKEEIVSKSLGVFRTKGYHGTSMQDLADACGLMKGSFYYYFESKEILMNEVLISLHISLQNEVFSIAYDDSIKPKKRLGKFLLNLENVLLNNENECILGKLVSETTANSLQFTTILHTIFKDWVSALTYIYALKNTQETALRYAQQTLMEFEGALILYKIFDNKSLIDDYHMRAVARM